MRFLQKFFNTYGFFTLLANIFLCFEVNFFFRLSTKKLFKLSLYLVQFEFAEIFYFDKQMNNLFQNASQGN